jgi:hypothetical protein
MFGNIYYFFGLILFLIDLGLLMNFFKIQKTRNWLDSFFKVTKRKPNENEIKIDEYQRVNSFQQTFAFNFLWIFFGLISKNWKFFLVILFLNFFLNIISKATVSQKKIYSTVEFVKFFIVTFSIGFSVINHFHLHLDVVKILIDYLS